MHTENPASTRPTQPAAPTPRDRRLEAVAANIVHQLGDALYDALPPDVAHKYFVDARQATNDQAIDFAKRLINDYATNKHTQQNQFGNS